MTEKVEIILFGFGDDSPAGFRNNRLQVELNKSEPLEAVVRNAGFDNLDGLVLLVNNQGIAPQDWSSTRIQGNDSIKILSAIEGG